MKNLVCVILFFLLAGIYIQVKASGCSNDQDCMVHGCGNKVPYCRLTVAHHHKHTNITGTCHCKDCHSNGDCHCIRGHPSCSLGSCHCVGCHSDGDCHCIHGRPSCSLGSCHCVGCHSDGDCHCIHGRPSCSLGSCHCIGCHSDNACHCTLGRPSCSQGSCHCVGCHSNSDCHCTNGRPSCSEGSCHCVAEMSCNYNNDCHGYGCGSSLYPQCANLDGHSRCLCEVSSPSARHECEQSSDCTKCPEYQVGKCNNNQCTCSAEMSCIYNNDCHGYGCGSSFYPQCANLDGHSRCLCESKASSPSARHECQQSSDCTKCPEYQVGKCNHNQCTCSAEMSCIYNNDCHGYGCGSGLYPQCASLDGHSRCLCEAMSPSNKHECEQDSDCTKCPEYQVGQCNHNQCTCSVSTPTSVQSTTTPVPPLTVTQLSSLACHTHTDCSGHICSSDKHPYCKFDEYSTICHCTVCTEHKHCICPEGLIGLCHFDIAHKNYSCSCGLAPDATTTVSKSSTSKSVPTTTLQSISVSSKSTTNFTPIPTTTQPSTVSSTTTSKSTTRIVYTASSSSVSSSTSAISPTSTSVPSTNPVNGWPGDWSSWSSCSVTCGDGLMSRSRVCHPPLFGGSPCPNNLSESEKCTNSPCGTPCPSCDDDLNCVWNKTCSTSQCCMARSPDHGFRFTVHCVQREDCRYMKTTSGNAEIYCCDDRECLRKFVGI